MKINNSIYSGVWTYQLIVPNTKGIKGKWGDLKVSGKIDNFKLKNKLGPMKNLIKNGLKF
jgi:hypothetical protein